MKKALKRSLSVLLAITIIFSSAYVGLSEVDFGGLFAVKVQAASNGTCGDNLTWTFDDEGTLTISGIGAMTNYAQYSSVPWIRYFFYIKSVVIDNGVTSISDYAFYCCSSFTSIAIPDSVTSIGDYAFCGCTNLTSITIPDSVTNIGISAFAGQQQLTSITIPDSVTSIGNGALYACNSLISITVDAANENYCTVEGVLFNKLQTELIQYPARKTDTTYTIPDGVTIIGDWAFYECTSLTSITIPDSVTSIGNGALYACNSLISIKVDATNENYCSVEGVLFNKLQTELIQYPARKTNTFYTIPDSVTSIGDYAFYYCNSFTSIAIPDSVTSIGGYAFYGCTSLTSITIPDSVTSMGDCTFRDCTNLTSITISNNVTSIGYSMFSNCTNLISITIPNSIISICHFGFSNCTSLTSITIPDSVTGIGNGAFSNCTSLTSITIPDSVTSIGDNAFLYCTNLTSITIPDSVTSMCDCTFSDCTNLTSITISNNVTSIGYSMFSNCTNLISITIPDSVTGIGNGAFSNCTSLRSIIIPSSVTSIKPSAFNGRDDLTIYGIPHSYAQTYAENNNIPFKDISDFGSISLQNNGTNINNINGTIKFNVYNKNAILEGDALGVAKGEVNSVVKGANLTCNGHSYVCGGGDKENETTVMFSDLAGKAIISKDEFYDYIIPGSVISNYISTKKLSLNVYLTKDRKDGKPYVSTVFGRIHDDDCENVYAELQSESLNITKDTTYDIVVTADIKGEDSATYYISQDEAHRISNSSGVFSAVELYNKFDTNKPIYTYAVTKSGKVTEPVTIQIEKIICSDVLTTLLSSPTLNLLGSDITGYAISDDIPIVGGSELSMDFLELPIGIEVEGERVRISIGRDFFKYSKVNGNVKDKDWINFKEYCKVVENQANDYLEKTDEFDKFLNQLRFGENIGKTQSKGFGFDASYLGYIEGYIINGNLVFTEFSGIIAAEFIANYTVNTMAGPVPVYYYVEGGAKALLNPSLARTIPDKNIPIEFDVLLGVTPKLKIGGGVGAKGLLSGGIYGSAELPTVYEFIDKHLTMALTGSVGIEGEVLFWSASTDLLSGTVNVIDEYFGVSEASLGDFSEAVLSDMAGLMYADKSEIKYSLASRDYAESTSGWVGYTNSGDLANGIIGGMQEPLYSSGIMSSATVTELQTSVYKNSQTQLIKFGDKIMLAYIEDCAERNTYNRYRLMYTIYNPSTNTWTQPKAVCDSGKMDISPSLAADGEDVYIAWQTVNTNPTGVTEKELYNALNNVEIYSAKYDSDSDSFVNVTQHTNNSTYDYSPYVTVENGSATVYWVNAESLDYAVGEMSIHSSADSSDTLVYDNLNYITTIKACDSEISYSMDVDGDLNTVNDIKLFTNGIQVGEDIVYDTAVVTNFTYGDFNGTETLFYSDGGTVYYIADGESIEAFSDKGGIADSLIITNLNGNPAVIYAQLTDEGSELRIATFDNDTWSEPVYLTDIGCSLSNADAVSVNGKVYAVFDRTQTTVAIDETTGDEILEYGKTDLCMLTSEGYYDLEISNIGYDEGDINIGVNSPFTVVMENKGTESINNIEFIVSDSLGYSQTIIKDVNLAPGAIESVELEYTAQEGYAACDLNVTATIVDCEDIDTTNNTTTEQIGRTDISVGAISIERIGDVFRISCEVVNDSLVEAENTIANISFDVYEKKVDIGTIAAKSSYIVELLVAKSELVFDENDICTLTFGASTTSEEFVTENNENTITVGNTEKIAEHEHNFVDNTCDSCGINAYLYEESDDGITIVGSNLSDSKYIIPAKINDKPVVTIGSDAFAKNEIITSVIIPDGVTSVGANAFNGCSSLTEVVVPRSVELIDTTAFADCTACAIHCYYGSYAHTFAIENSIAYVIMDFVTTNNSYIDYENKYIVIDSQASNDIYKNIGIDESSDVELLVIPSYMNNGNQFFGTGSIVYIYNKGTYQETYTLVVTGDVNGDSVCDVLDATQVAKASNGHTTLDGAYALAADSNADDIVDINDYQAIVNKAVS